ncbi:O-methyltransferase [Egicoccus sp. AB-alg6-2]|uniref:O-methyltransferase n=1 Tax=Egicoccus sp. AB-alg6-2 TaxID=3242692 RepID=UPI00359E0443
MNRRASLPGVDALFGTSDPGGRRQAEEAGSAPSRPGLQALVPESATLRAVRERLPADTVVPDPTVTALLRWLVTTARARTVVEVGAAGGVSGVALLEALPDRAVLTSIEPDGHAHGLAVDAFREAGAGSRVRSIHGEPETVLPRLTDGGYDLVVWQTPITEAADALGHVRRLLRQGGVLVARGLVTGGGGRAQAETFVAELLDGEDFSVAVLPLDGGIVLATHTTD